MCEWWAGCVDCHRRFAFHELRSIQVFAKSIDSYGDGLQRMIQNDLEDSSAQLGKRIESEIALGLLSFFHQNLQFFQTFRRV